jgi:DnaK suppressor protein
MKVQNAKGDQGKNGLSEAEWNKLASRLRDERKSVLDSLARHEVTAREGHETTADESDQASSETERVVTLQLLDNERRLLAELDHALTKVEDGSYGRRAHWPRPARGASLGALQSSL